jgi:hypothetical protein
MIASIPGLELELDSSVEETELVHNEDEVSISVHGSEGHLVLLGSVSDVAAKSSGPAAPTTSILWGTSPASTVLRMGAKLRTFLRNPP